MEISIRLTFNIYNILIIVGIIQGFIFTAVVLWSKKYHAKSTFFLVTLIFCYSLGNLMYILPDIGTMPLLTMYSYIYLPIASIDAPIMYFYVILLLHPTKKILVKEKLLFAPFIGFLILTLIFRFRIILGHDAVDSINPTYRFIIIFHEMFSVVFSIVLLIISIYKIVLFEKQNSTFNINVIRSNLKWLKTTLIIILLFVFLWGYLTVRNIFYTNGETIYYSLWLGLAFFIYWLGHIGIYKYGILSDRIKIRQFLGKNRFNDHNNTSSATTSKPNNDHIIALEKLLIKEKMYLDSNLSLEKIAEHLQLSPSYLSRIINSELNTSFPDYLNSLRVKEAKSYLKNPDFSNYTIVAIGLEAGFNSRSSFYNIFKKTTGKTPMAYQKEKISV
jgi:AraC-like DNA-binding protein